VRNSRDHPSALPDIFS